MAFVALIAPFVWAADAATCANPINTQCSSSSTASARQDPHLNFAHGGSADFRGEDGKFYALLSTPGVHFAARTQESDFLLPKGPLLVHGSFFTEVAFVLRSRSGRAYGIKSDANVIGFDVLDLGMASHPHHLDPELIVKRRGVWTDWKNEDIGVFYKYSTLVVRSNGWETNCTRNHIYNHISGDSRWRFDIAMRMLTGTEFEANYGTTSKTCYPHGIIAQSYDGDDLAVDGAKDNYTYNPLHPVFTTRAQAEGAIDGGAKDYVTHSPFDTEFRYNRFFSNAEDECAARDVNALGGVKWKRGGGSPAGSSL